MTTKVTNTPPRGVQSPQKCRSPRISPQRSTHFPPLSPDIPGSLRAITFHPQQRYLSLAEYLSTNTIPPATAISRLETWSDSASEEIYNFYSPARGINGL